MSAQLHLFGGEEQKPKKKRRKPNSPEDRLQLLAQLALDKLAATDPEDITVRDAIELLKLAIAEEKRLSGTGTVRVQLRDAIRKFMGCNRPGFSEEAVPDPRTNRDRVRTAGSGVIFSERTSPQRTVRNQVIETPSGYVILAPKSNPLPWIDTECLRGRKAPTKEPVCCSLPLRWCRYAVLPAQPRPDKPLSRHAGKSPGGFSG